jgi:hypothetical protein
MVPGQQIPESPKERELPDKAAQLRFCRVEKYEI